MSTDHEGHILTSSEGVTVEITAITEYIEAGQAPDGPWIDVTVIAGSATITVRRIPIPKEYADKLRRAMRLAVIARRIDDGETF
jgi:hypothetical protein